MANGGDVLDFGLSLLGLAGIIGVAWAVFRVKGTQTIIDLLEQSVRIERTERLEIERRCKEERHVMQGRIDALTGDIGRTIAKAVREELDR